MEEKKRALSESELSEPIVRSYARIISNHAGLVVLVTLLIQIGSTVLVARDLPEVDPGGSSYVSRDGVLPAQVANLQVAQEETLFNINESGKASVVVDDQSVLAYAVQVIWLDGGEDESLFTAERLEAIKRFEDDFIATEGYDEFCYKTSEVCEPPLSPTMFFYGSIVSTGPNTTAIVPNRNGTELIPEDRWPEAIRAMGDSDFFRNLLLDISYNNETFLGTLTTRSVFQFGLPLPDSLGDFINPETDNEDQAELFDEWVRGPFDDLLVPAFNGERSGLEGMELYFLGSGVTDIEFAGLIGESGMFSGFAMMFVFFYLMIVTQSATLGALGTWHILMAFPGAYLIYSVVFGAKVFTTLNILAIFIVLGIGADDIFVFLDAWKQSAYEGPSISEKVVTRMEYTLSRSVWAMFVTSLTSSAAFFANAASPIPGIRYFGLWTGALIVVNYFYVISWFPAVTVLHYRSARYGCLSCCTSLTKARAKATLRGTGMVRPVAPRPKPRALEIWFRESYAPWVFKHRWAVLLLFGVVIVLSVIQVFALKPAENQSQFIRDDQNAFLAGSVSEERFPTSDLRTDIVLVYGLDPGGVNRANTDPLDPDDLGQYTSVPEFDPSDADTQQFIVDSCDAVAALDTTDEVTCFMQGLWDYMNVTSPIPSGDFLEAAHNYSTFLDETNFDTSAGNDFIGGFTTTFADQIGFQDSEPFEVVWIGVIARTTYSASLAASQARPVYNIYQVLVDSLIADAPAGKGLEKLFQTSNRWIGMVTEEALVFVAIGAIALSIALAFVVLGASTRNLFITFAATLTIGGIALTSTAIMPLIGWDLGVIESINLTIVVGLAVDYVVHFGVAYVESRAATRLTRIQDSLGELGISIVSAAFSTIGATAFMLPAKVAFFSRFGGFIIFVSIVSLFYSTGFFFALVSIWGPTRSRKSIELSLLRGEVRELHAELARVKEMQEGTDPLSGKSTSPQAVSPASKTSSGELDATSLGTAGSTKSDDTIPGYYVAGQGGAIGSTKVFAHGTLRKASTYGESPPHIAALAAAANMAGNGSAAGNSSKNLTEGDSTSGGGTMSGDVTASPSDSDTSKLETTSEQAPAFDGMSIITTSTDDHRKMNRMSNVSMDALLEISGVKPEDPSPVPTPAVPPSGSFSDPGKDPRVRRALSLDAPESSSPLVAASEPPPADTPAAPESGAVEPPPLTRQDSRKSKKGGSNRSKSRRAESPKKGGSKRSKGRRAESPTKSRPESPTKVKSGSPRKRRTTTGSKGSRKRRHQRGGSDSSRGSRKGSGTPVVKRKPRDGTLNSKSSSKAKSRKPLPELEKSGSFRKAAAEAAALRERLASGSGDASTSSSVMAPPDSSPPKRE